jgi:predicted acetyltransferase
MLSRLLGRRRDVRYYGAVVDLVQEQESPASRFNDETRSIYYGIYLHDSDIRVGSCDLRIGNNRSLYYAGNIGYNILPPFRGHGFAYQACTVLLPVAKEVYGFQHLIITCSPENIASRKTLEKLDGKLLEITPVPPDHWLYKRGETVKNIYEYDL